MMQPLILIPARRVTDLTLAAYRTDFRLNVPYLDAVKQAGGIPLLAAGGDAAVLAKRTDALLLPGGIDVNPQRYGESPVNATVRWDDKIDDFEIALFSAFRQLGKPIFGICRGHQLINVAAGGTLWQDLHGQADYVKSHRDNTVSWTHDVQIRQDSIIGRLFGTACQTNSHHHQAVRRVAPGFLATAHAPDGIIEAIEHQSEPILAVQWHPERMLGMMGQPEAQETAHLTEMTPLFEYFVSLCTP